MTLRFVTAMLLCGTALSTTAIAGFADSALAQAVPAGSAEAVTVIGNGGHKTADGVTGLQPGGGLIKIQVAPKSISTVTKDYILKQAPASSPFELVQLLPGANVAEVDPWGLSGGSMSLRGLDNTEMAFIWEGMPIADVGVYTTYPSEFADTE
ncbi:MAG: TonB-dependent receptor plug domain-containing protein, partial [Janthinobacterium lividum]